MRGNARTKHETKKVGKTLKQKRAEKHAAHPEPHVSIIPPRRPSTER